MPQLNGKMSSRGEIERWINYSCKKVERDKTFRKRKRLKLIKYHLTKKCEIQGKGRAFWIFSHDLLYVKEVVTHFI